MAELIVTYVEENRMGGDGPHTSSFKGDDLVKLYAQAAEIVGMYFDDEGCEILGIDPEDITVNMIKEYIKEENGEISTILAITEVGEKTITWNPEDEE